MLQTKSEVNEPEGINEKTIWSVRQNHPELVVQDCQEEFGLNEEQCEKLRFILLKRGINKWFYARRLFIALKHRVKESFKVEMDKRTRKILEWINADMQHIAKMPRWVEWGRKVHKNMENNEREIVIRGKRC